MQMTLIRWAGILLVAGFWAAGVVAAEIARPTVLITGSSRGIGFELARQYAEKGWGVVATARNPAGATFGGSSSRAPASAI